MESDRLFQLVHSLSRSEKRYFKVYAGRRSIGECNHYLRLFDAIAGQASYDEAAIRAQFAGTKAERHLPSIRVQLRKLILKSMRAYRAGHSVDARLREHLEDAEFLREKGLYAESDRSLAKAEKLAWQHERHASLLEILFWKRRAVLARRQTGLESELEAIQQQSATVVAQLTNLQAYEALYDEVFALTRISYTDRSSMMEARLQEIGRDPLLVHPDAAQSYRARIRFHQLQALLAQLAGDQTEAWKCNRAIVAEWDARPDIRQQHPQNYRIALSNYLAACHRAGRFDEFPEHLARLHALPPSSPDDAAEHFQNVYFYELLYHLNQGNPQQAATLVPQIEAGLAQYREKVNKARALGFRYNIMVIFFVLERWGPALKWLNKIIHDERSEHRQDIQQAARLFLLIIHYERANEDILDHLLRSAYRYFYRRETTGDFERIVLKALKQIYQNPPPAALKRIFSALQTELQGLLDRPEGPHPPGLRELNLWLRARLEVRPIWALLTSADS